MAKINVRPASVEILEEETRTWPASLRAAWIDAHDPAFGTHDWVPQTRYTSARVFTRYLASIEPHQLGSGECLLQPASLRRFLREAERSCCLRTLHGYVHQLLQVASIVYRQEFRDGKLAWLRRTRERLHQTAQQTPKQRRDRIIAAPDLLWAAQSAIEEARSLAGWAAAQRYRDGLFILLGLTMPERRRALCSLRLDQIDLDEGRVTFEAAQIKTKEVRHWIIEPGVAALLSEWIEVWRAAHARPSVENLFVGKGGGPVGDDAMYEAMRQLTTKKLGRSISPHLLRNAAGTGLLEHEPGRPGLVSLLLGHRSAATREEYTERAKALLASRTATAMIDAAGEAAARAVRRSTRSTGGHSQRRHRRVA